jgi:UDP-N-acetylmuramoyl-tripeptide--D-alanyl-D-alanine ligase
VTNALAAAAAAIAAGASLDDVRKGLRCMSAVDGRMALLRGAANCRVIDDTYNANPGSMRAALDFLTGLEGLPWAILGDMGELGEQSHELHAEVGDYARSVGVEKLFVVGRLGRVLADHFGTGAESFSDIASLIDAVRPRLSDDVNVLVKGSRSMGMERVVAGLTAPAEDPRAAEGGR